MKFVLFAAMFYCISCSAQKVIVDKITGDTAWFCGFEKLYSKASLSGNVGEQLKVATSRSKRGYELSLFIQTGKSMSYRVGEGSFARAKCKDGTVIDLIAKGSGSDKISDGLNGGSSISVFAISNDQLNDLLKKEIVFIRIEGSPNTLEFDIKDKFKNVVSTCLKQVIK